MTARCPVCDYVIGGRVIHPCEDGCCAFVACVVDLLLPGEHDPASVASQVLKLAKSPHNVISGHPTAVSKPAIGRQVRALLKARKV